MTVIEKISEINSIVKDIFDFVTGDDRVKSDFDEYLRTIGAANISLERMEKVFLPYIFERRIDGKSIFEMFKEGGCKNKELLDGFINSISSVFEIKKILKNGFELYNLVNEKLYTTLSLTKMTSFRGIYAGQYIVARIFKFREEYYIIEISSVLSHSQKDEAMRYAVMKLVQSPKLLYIDNPEKEAEIKNNIDEMYKKFIKAFDTDIILTTNKYADEIIGSFNDGDEISLEGKLSDISEYKFFHIKELENNYGNFLENSVGGFGSHYEHYDVAVIFDKQKGLYAIPFFETFTKIFEDKNSVENAKACLEYFLTNNSIQDSILERVAAKYDNFMSTINEILETDFTFDDLIDTYKSEYKKSTMYSSATVLYSSKVFSNVFDVITAEKTTKADVQKVGRNEPCPCGSGKKYKNCCMNLQ